METIHSLISLKKKGCKTGSLHIIRPFPSKNIVGLKNSPVSIESDDNQTLDFLIQLCKKLKLKTLVFAKDLNEALKVEKLKPDYLVFEPPELVGGNKSVSSAKPQLIKKISENLKMNFLVGAGIKTKSDIDTAIMLGASGIVISSVVANSTNPLKNLRRILSWTRTGRN